MKRTFLKLLLLLWVVLEFSTFSFAQDSKLSISGGAGTNLEWYNFTSSDTSRVGRRPPFNYNFFINPVIQIGEKVSIPINFTVSKRQTNLLLPLPKEQSPLEYLTNPNNDVGLHPTFDWATFHIGAHTPKISDLTIGNIPIFGAGIDLNPGKFRFAASTGFSSLGVEADSSLNILGVYRRQFQAVKIGVGTRDKSGLYFNLVRVKDKEESVDSPLSFVAPEEGLVASTDLQLKLGKHVTLEGELAGSAFTPDANETMMNDSSDFIIAIPEQLMPTRQNTRMDWAAKAKLGFDFDPFGISFNADRIGAGFKSLGYPFQQSDILDLTVSPRFNLFNNKFILNGTAGYRVDNLSSTKLASTTNFIAAANANAIFSKQFNVSANYANYGIRNNVDNDTLKVEYLSSNLSVTPSFRFGNEANKHFLSFTWSKSEFEDLNLLTGQQNNNNNTVFSALYSLSNEKWSLGLNASHINNQQFQGDIRIFTSGLRLAYNDKDKRLQISTALNRVQSSYFGSDPDKQWIIRPDIRWGLNKKLSLNIRGSLNFYQYGSRRDTESFQEQRLQTGLNYQF